MGNSRQGERGHDSRWLFCVTWIRDVFVTVFVREYSYPFFYVGKFIGIKESYLKYRVRIEVFTIRWRFCR